jgi:flavin reductase (DIM6/NTAB) family NADH-FMN oxidoreductase RutF
MAISKDEFRAALGSFASGVTVVTTKDSDGKLHGMTVSAFCSVSMNPPLILICILKETPCYYAFEEAKAFVVNILSESQQHLSNHFASRQHDKFTGIAHNSGILGLPVLDDCLVNLECSLKHSYDGGDHTIFVGEIQKATVKDGKPLAYFHGKYREISD